MQYVCRSLRAVQFGTAALFFLGEQLFGYFGRPRPHVIVQMHNNKLLTVAGIYGLDVIVQTLKAVNAFEITYNGHVLHSKLSTNRFPIQGELSARLREIIAESNVKAVEPAASA